MGMCIVQVHLMRCMLLNSLLSAHGRVTKSQVAPSLLYRIDVCSTVDAVLLGACRDRYAMMVGGYASGFDPFQDADDTLDGSEPMASGSATSLGIARQGAERGDEYVIDWRCLVIIIP